ncbi:putative vinorine synthase [Rosa chinensis]|uniref:Putative vinorine synthase n=1 Tax=Rosa chinensis TaxID=74649 RepID=A0A2P6R0S8_ROSCH|nr:stemmadenine O-acetyltransferase [Rosa chinensis]PRQ40045.1 putative vinorine synthase [Rosa chinensis]
MKVEVEVISKEIITPSSPTPAHFRHYQLSSFDQLAPPVYNPLVLFYEFNDKTVPNITEISSHLKKSLAEVLTVFYPLAGRIKHDDWLVDCNDEGIPYLEAHVNCKLSDFLKNPIPDQLSKFMPFELDDHIGKELVLGVQLSIFECGGFAIGQCISHRLADGSSYFMFSKTWAAIAHGESNIEHPDFLSATRFPLKDVMAYDPSTEISRNKVTKRFLFSASMIEALRAKYGESAVGIEENQKRPSRVDALTAFIWSRYMANTNKITGPHDEKLYRIAHAVNLRPRFDPPLPQHSFGNIYRGATSGPLLSTGDACSAYGRAMREVREEINKIDNDCVKGLQQGAEQSGLPFNENTGRLTELELVTLGFSSYCRFPVYDNDFGWGRPAWVFSTPLTFKNVATFMDTKEGDGIEVYISLEEQLMAKFETDAEFLAPMCLQVGAEEPFGC